MKTLLACSFLAVALFSQADGRCITYNMTATCDDYMTVYFDGVEQPCPPDPLNGCAEWATASTFEVPWYTREITIKCLGAGGPTGVLAYFEDGTMTDDSWYCTPIAPGDECPPGPWPAAVDYGAYGTILPGPIPWGPVAGMPDSPHWIWTDDPGHNGDWDACCRMYSRKLGFCSTVDVDDNMELYFNGIQVPHEPDFDVWYNASTVCMPWNTELIAIHGHNVNGPSGIVGTFANGAIMTDGTWLCTNSTILTIPPGPVPFQWYEVGYDDSGWPNAKDYGAYNPPLPGHPIPTGDVNGMTPTPGLDWIWTDKAGYIPPHPDNGDQDVYCRKDISRAGYWMTVTCDDILRVFFDGVEVTDGPHPNSMDRWYEVTTIFVPWNTQVIAMNCSNGGGPSGFLAHFSTGLITDARWSCIDKAQVVGDSWMYSTFTGVWPAAVDYGSQPGPKPLIPYVVVQNMPDDPHWIWNDNPGHRGDRKVYCRIDLGCDCYHHTERHNCYCP